MLYIHVPFCQSRCIYCDFYSTVAGDSMRKRYVASLVEELQNRRDYLPSSTLWTVYLGGGTPSMLSDEELDRVMECVRDCYELHPGAELTFEANPDDITPAKVDHLRQLGFNRISLGVQSFNDGLLRLLNRRHTAAEAIRAVETIVSRGIDNVSIDLMYGLPQQTEEMFEHDLRQALALPVKHLSSYALTVEEGTALCTLIRRGELRTADEEAYRREYERLMDLTGEAGFEHYEISNFALPGFYSRHNSAYWDGTPYLGCGPGAHSFNGTERRFNLPDLKRYAEQPGNPPNEVETLTKAERFDELLFTSLRTRQGLSLGKVENGFGKGWLRQLIDESRPFRERGLMKMENGCLALTRQGIFVSDSLISDLMRG